MEELLPLYAAVTHGCLAGRSQAALRVFRHRIRLGDDNFSIERLGAFGADLSALASFFDVAWSRVEPSLQPDEQLFLFQAVGECLSALGRVVEAEAPFQHALRLAHQQEQWTSAALAATKLSEVYRAHGDLLTALCFAEQSAAYVRRHGVPAPAQLLSYAFLGCAQYWVGLSEEALTTFQEAEQVQQCANPERPILHGIPGYMYCELLLDRLASRAEDLTTAQFTQAWCDLQARIAQALTWARQDALLCDTGLQHVSMGRVYALAWQHHIATEVSPVTAQQQASTHVARAVESLRLSNRRNYLPRALLASAALYRLQGNLTRAQQAVDEVLDIAQGSAMDFYQADAYLEQACISLAAYQAARHVDHHRHAEVSLHTLIDQMGYYRRRRQVVELEAMLQHIASS
jgi:tetratricopeptide (TPR) repeat protein